MILSQWAELHKIREWMYTHKDDYVDSAGEVSCTQLAEAACDALNGYYSQPPEIPEFYFELAYEVVCGCPPRSSYHLEAP